MWWQGVCGVNSAEWQRGARARACLLVGAGVCVGAGGCWRLVTLRVGGDSDGFVGVVQVWNWREGPSPLAVAGNLDTGNRAKQAEARSPGHHVRTGARRECPRARTLPSVRRTCFSTHDYLIYYANRTCHTLNFIYDHEHTRNGTPAPAGHIVRKTKTNSGLRKHNALKSTNRRSSRVPTCKQRCMCLPAKFWQFSRVFIKSI